MSDPVADFLAREQDFLADIEGEAPPPPPQNDNAPPSLPPTFDDIIEDPSPPVAAPPPVDDIVYDLGGNMEHNLSFNSNKFPFILNTKTDLNEINGHSETSSPIPVFPKIEAENIRRWKEEQAVKLEKKDEEEKKKIADMKNAAGKELDEWYKQRDATLKAVKESNRKAEEDHLAAFNKEQGENAQWNEIAKLCEAKAQKGGKDVSRMKSLLLHLKEQQSK